jgi:hypothetical protein
VIDVAEDAIREKMMGRRNIIRELSQGVCTYPHLICQLWRVCVSLVSFVNCGVCTYPPLVCQLWRVYVSLVSFVNCGVFAFTSFYFVHSV